MAGDESPLTPTNVTARSATLVNHGPYPTLDLNIGSPPRPVQSPPPSVTAPLQTRFEMNGLAEPFELPTTAATSPRTSCGDNDSGYDESSEDSGSSSPTLKEENWAQIAKLHARIEKINAFVSYAQEYIDGLHVYIERRFFPTSERPLFPSSGRTVSLSALLAENNIGIDDVAAKKASTTDVVGNESGEDIHSITSAEASSNLMSDEEYVRYLQRDVAELKNYAEYLLKYAYETDAYGKMRESELRTEAGSPFAEEAGSPFAEEDDTLTLLAEKFQAEVSHRQWRKGFKAKNQRSAEKNYRSSNGRYMKDVNLSTVTDFYHRRWDIME